VVSKTFFPYGELVVIARDVTGAIVTRITSKRDLLGAMNTAWHVLRLKVDAMRVEVHRRESLASDYPKKPLAAFSREDVPIEQFR
jgi:hypothetical protein